MEVLIGLGVTILAIYLAIKILKAIARALTAPLRSKSKKQSHTSGYTIEVSYGDGSVSSYDDSEKYDTNPSKYWRPFGQRTKVGKTVLPDGMVYVGKKLGSPDYEYSLEAALIDPSLKVKNGTLGAAANLGYWPSYKGISSVCRGEYLSWLARGRSDPEADIGFVFLFFYGLERRLLADTQVVDVSDKERDEIRQEVKRLLTIYGDHGSFSKYANSFLSYTASYSSDDPLYRGNPPVDEPSWEIPMSVRIAVAQASRDGVPVPVKWAFAWTWYDPETNIRTPARRCRQEIETLFSQRYLEKYGEGVVVKPNKRCVKIEYRPASPTMAAVPVRTLEDLPDVASLKGPIRKLRDIFDACTNELDAYSRWLGRNPDSKESLQAMALLPPDLLTAENLGDAGGRLQKLLSDAVHEGDPSRIDPEAILKFWPPSKDGKYRKSDAVALAQFLEKMGYGVEPDVRFNGPRLDSVENTIVFTLAQDAPSAPTRDYTAAELSLRLAAIVAVADGIVTEDEQRVLEQQLSASSALRPGDRDRLHAHLEWLLLERPKLTGLKRKLAELKPSMRALLGQTLLIMAAADGVIDPEEVKTIRKLYGQLGLDPDSVYSDLHSLAATDMGPATAPVTVRPEEHTTGYAIPDKGEAGATSRPSARVVLDPKLIAAKRQESQKAATLLGSIFSEDDDEPANTQPDLPTAAVAGLDGPHSAMLMRLAEKNEWAVDDVASIAEEFGLLAEGALETINEAAWDTADSPLLEISESVTIDKAVLEELLA